MTTRAPASIRDARSNAQATPARGWALAGRPLVVSWVLQVIAAVILGQTLFFKFSGADETRYIFSTLGVEPWGRYFAGTSELVCVVLLLIPRTAAIGAAVAIATMIGALGAHFTKLGIAVKDDGGLLFALAWIVLLASAGVLRLRRGGLPIVGPKLIKS